MIFVTFVRNLFFCYFILVYEGKVLSQNIRPGSGISTSSTASGGLHQSGSTRGSSGGAARSGITSATPGTGRGTAISSPAPKASPSGSSQPNLPNSSLPSGGRDGQHQSRTGSSATSKLKLFKTGSDGNKVEMSEGPDFQMRHLYDEHTYKFKDDVKCILVKFEGNDVWKKGDHSVQEPKYVAYNSTFDSITVRDSQRSVLFGKDTSTGEWKYVNVLGIKNPDVTQQPSETKKSSESRPEQTSPSSHPTKETSETQYGSSSPTTSDTSLTQSSSSSTAQPRKTGFDLNIKSDTQSTDKFSYEKVGEYVTYPAKGDNAFKVVKEGSTNIWQASDVNNYSAKVEVEHMNNDSKAVTIHTDDKTKIFIRSASGQPWTEIDTTKVNDRTININFPNESYFYTNELKGETRTFSAKKGFAFKGANDYVNDKKVEVWKTDEESEYANKIVNEGGKKVTLHLADGSTKVIQKGSDGKWPPDSETSKTGVDLNIKSDKKSNKKLEYEKVGEYVTYIAKDNYAFKLVKDKTEVWKATDATNYSPRVEVEFLANDGKAVTIFLRKNKTKVFKKEGTNNPWKEIDLTKVTPSSVNINYPHQSYFYTNELKGKIRTFSAKTGFAFKYANEYIDGNKVEIWKTDNESEYSNKIEVNFIDNDGKAVTIHLGENKTKVFIQSGKNQPWTEIDTTKVNPKSVNIEYENSSYFYSNKLDNGVRTFTAKTGFMFNLVRHLVNNDWVDIWKTHKESEYANKIANEGGKKITIHLANGCTKVIEKGSDGKWPGDTSIVSQKPQSGPAEGSGASSGPRARSAPASRGDTATPTSTSISPKKDENEDSSESQQPEQTSPSTQPTEPASEPQPSSAQGTSPPAKTSTDTSQTQSSTGSSPATTSPKTCVDINITSDTQSTDKFDYKKAGQYVTYTAKGDNAFKLVKDGTTRVWEATDDTCYSSKVEVQFLNNNGKAVTICLDENNTKVFKKDGNDQPWNEFDTNNITRISMNIKYSDETYFYKNELKGNVRTFSAKKGFGFKGANEYVDDKKVEIWKTDNQNEYANKIVNEGGKKLTIYIGDDGTAKVFNKGSDGKWTEDTSIVSQKPQSSPARGTIPPAKTSTDTSQKQSSSSSTPQPKESSDDQSSQAGQPSKKVENGSGAGSPVTTPPASPTSGAEDKAKKSTETAKRTGIEVCIKNNKNATPQFDYKKDGKTVTYTAKDNYGFKLVKQKNTEIWKANDESEYATKVVIEGKGENDKKVTIYLPNNTTRVFNRVGKGKPWTDVSPSAKDPVKTTGTTPTSGSTETSGKGGSQVTSPPAGGTSKSVTKELQPSEYPQDIKLFGADPGDSSKTVELTTDKYKVKKDENNKVLLHYRFNDGVNCTLINHDNKEVWKHDSSKHSGKYPKSFTYNKKNFKIIMTFSDIVIVCEKDDDGNWKVTENTIELVELNLKSEGDVTDKCYYSKENDVANCTPKDGKFFQSVKIENDLIWKTDNPEEFASEVELVERPSGIIDLTIYFPNKKIKLFVKKSADKQWEEIDLTKVNPRSVNIICDHESYYYTNKLTGSIRTFEAKQGFGFNLVGTRHDLGQTEIWSTVKENEYAKKVINEGDNKVSIHTGDGAIKVFNKGDNNKWKYDSAASAQQSKKTSESQPEKSSEDTDASTQPTEPASVPQPISSETEEKSKSGGFSCSWDTMRGWLCCSCCGSCRGSSTSISGVDINIKSDTKSGNKYTYQKVGEYVTYTAKDNYAFKLVKDDKTEIWNEIKANYSPRVEVEFLDNKGKAVTINLPKNKTRVFKNDGTNKIWKEIDTNEVNAMPVNINYPHESYFCKNELENNVRTFTAKRGFAFVCANEYVNNKVEIWRTYQESEYANKIVNEGGNKLTIHLGDGSTKVFTKGSDGTWKAGS